MKKAVKKSKAFKVFSIILSVLLLISAGIAVWEMISLNVLPSGLFVPVTLVVVILCLIALVLLHAVSRRAFSRVITSFFVLVLTAAFAMGSFYLYRTSHMLSSITTHDGEVKNTVSVITLDNDDAENLEDMDGYRIGYLRSIDNYGTEQLLKAAEDQLGLGTTSYAGSGSFAVYADENDETASEEDPSEDQERVPTFEEDYSDLPFTHQDYVSVQAMAQALYDGDVDAIVLNEIYRSNLEEIDGYQDFEERTKVVFETVYYTSKANDALVVSDITTESFNILISGNDTYGDVGELSRSDVNMVVTVNPSTGTVLLTSIPRDTYVESACDAEDACQVGAMDKITHLGMHGVNASKMTVENLLGIEINYTFRVNFSSVTDIVDALGGVDIYIEEGMAVETFYADSSLEGVVEGWNHLDGERALAFARERYAYTDGDNQRVKNQQKVLEALVEKATSPDIIVNYASLMEAFSGAFETNMSTEELTTLLQYQLSANPDWTFETNQIDVVGDMLYCAELGQNASVSIPDMRSVQIAREKIEAVMDGESSDSVDTSWLDTTDPVYNYWGNYDHTLDYRTDLDNTYRETYQPEDATTYETYYDNSYITNNTYNNYETVIPDTTTPETTVPDSTPSQDVTVPETPAETTPSQTPVAE